MKNPDSDKKIVSEKSEIKIQNGKLLVFERSCALVRRRWNGYGC